MFGLDKIFAKKVSKSAKRRMTKEVSGFNKEEFSSFMQASRSVGSQQNYMDSENMKPSFQTKRVGITQANPFGRENGKVVSQDQMKGMLKAFEQRQKEVFGRRAAPGIAQQTRFM